MSAADVALTVDLRGDAAMVAAVATYSRRHGCSESTALSALLLSLLLCQEIDVERTGRGRLEQVPEAAGEVALEAADGLRAGLAVGALAGEVSSGGQ